MIVRLGFPRFWAIDPNGLYKFQLCQTPGETLEELKKVVDVPKAGNTEADIETLLNLMGEDKPRAAWPFEC